MTEPLRDDRQVSTFGGGLAVRPLGDSSVYGDRSLNLPDNTPIEDWERVGAAIGHMTKNNMWWLGDWRRYGDNHYGSLADHSDAAGVEYQTLADSAWVASKVEVSRRRETLSWSHHREVAALEPDDQEHYLDMAEADGLSHKDLRTAIRRGRVAVARNVTLPPGKFSVLYADPPWQYDFVEADNRAIENQYPTLTADEIACYEDSDRRPIADLPADDAVLFLWATNPKLLEALVVMQGWGFTYTTNAAWVKDRIGMGYWFRQRHELLLVGKRGNFPAPVESARKDSVIESPRTAHSAKPESVYGLIEAMHPDLSDRERVEIFARQRRPGWTPFGNQL